jgi:hypothetical protein
MLAAEPAKRRPPGRPRKPRPRGRPRKPPADNGADHGESPAPRPSARERRAKAADHAAKALWEKAAALSDAPWKLVAERHRRATRGDLLIATRSNQPMPEYRRPTISGSGPP